LIDPLRVARPTGWQAAILCVLLLTAACGIAQETAPERSRFWQAFEFGPAVHEVSRFATLRELFEASDAVVTGRVIGVRVSRVIQGDAAQDQVAMVCVDLEALEVVAGKAPDPVCVEFLGGSPAAAQALVQVASMSGLPSQPAIAFLHEKQGQGEAGIYRVTNSTGLWAATVRSSLDAPLRSETPQAAGLYAVEIGGADISEELLAALRSW